MAQVVKTICVRAVCCGAYISSRILRPPWRGFFAIITKTISVSAVSQGAHGERSIFSFRPSFVFFLVFLSCWAVSIVFLVDCARELSVFSAGDFYDGTICVIAPSAMALG